MKKLFVLLVSSGVIAALGTLMAEVTSASAAACHCKRGAPGPQGPRGVQGPSGPRGPVGPGFSNFDYILTAVGATHQVTIGHFTISDVNDNGTNGGCGGITVFDPQSYVISQFTGSTGVYRPFGSVAGGSKTPISSTPGTAMNFFMAYDSTLNYVTGEVGDTTGSVLPSGILPCIDIGGVAGS